MGRMARRELLGAIVLLAVVSLCHASPDMGLDIQIDYITRQNPTVQGSASVGSTATSELKGALGSFKPTIYPAGTNLAEAGGALVDLIGNLTVTVNYVLSNLTAMTTDRTTAPSCLFGNLNATIDSALSSMESLYSLVTKINGSTSASTGNSIASSINFIHSGLFQMVPLLDTLYAGVAKVVATGQTPSDAIVASNIQPGNTIQLTGAISVMVSSERALAAQLQQVRTAFDNANNILVSYNNDMSSALTAINNTQKDYYNQLVSRISTFVSRIASNNASALSELATTNNNLNAYIQDTTIRANAQLLLDTSNSVSSSINLLSVNYGNNAKTILTETYLGAEAFTQGYILSMIPVLNNATFNLTTTLTLAGPYASNCNGIYGSSVTTIDNNMRDQLQRCFNDYANSGYLDAIQSEYDNVIREQTREVKNAIQFCINLGSTTSASHVKAGISACMAATVPYIQQLLFDLGTQTVLINALLNLEGLAMVQRVENCGIMSNTGLIAKANAMKVLVTQCQTTNK